MGDDLKTPMHRHMQFALAFAIGIVALLLALLLHAPLPYSIGANVFFVSYIALVLALMPGLTGRYLSRNARATDMPVLLIFAVTLFVVVAAIVSLFLLINRKDAAHPWQLAFAMLSIPLGWFTIHAMASLHYAHVYWKDGDEIDVKTQKKMPVGGLDFPGGRRPEGWDFLYFATVIGMTAQTADTAITTSQMRLVVLI
ncbi:MAG: DUF1345 domain-containing protein, partial [Mesorhizobium sp.]